MKTVHFVRGIPGSGKTTKAKELAAQSKCNYFEADYSSNQPDWLNNAHHICRTALVNYLQEHEEAVVANPFISVNDFEDYLSLLVQAFKEFRVNLYFTEYRGQSTSDLPGHVIDRMRHNLLKNSDIIDYFSKRYSGIEFTNCTELTRNYLED